MFLPLIAVTLAVPIRPGTCLSFSGDSQVVVVPSQKAMDLEQATVEVWIKVEANERYYNYILCHNYADLGYGLAIHGRPGKVFSQAADTTVPVGRWTHLAIAYSDKSEKVYVNGELAAARERSGPLKPITKDMLVGNSDMFGSPGNEPTPFHGLIDEMRIWDKPLTQQEIRARMGKYLRGNEAHLVAYFPFDEGVGQIAHDYTGHWISGSLGRSFQTDDGDPTWAEGVALKGKQPRIRARR